MAVSVSKKRKSNRSKKPPATAVAEKIEIAPEPLASAKEAGLRYTTDDSPGIQRVRAGRGFRYVDERGRAIKNRRTLDRIKELVIPPAWTEVWICPQPRGHLQATGRDARGRKQHLYHPKWRAVRDETKFDKMIAFGQALPSLRRKTTRHLKLPGQPREKILAAVVRLLEKTLIRVGNEEYAKTNKHFGLTTLHNKHVDVHGADVHFEFKGKSGVLRTIDLHSPRLAKIISKCQDLPGHDLFEYLDSNGDRIDVTSADVNAYLQELTGQPFTAKDFRTWAGTSLAMTTLAKLPAFKSVTEAKRNVVQTVKTVAQRLGNTQAVCRKCYIHPRVLESYLEGQLPPPSHPTKASSPRAATNSESTLIAFLKKHK